MEGTDFLREKYGLHTSKEVERAAKRTEMRMGKKLLPKSEEDNNMRIQNYLDRLGQIINPPKLPGHPDFDRKQRNLELLKKDLYDEFVIKPETIPEAYFESIKRRHLEEGHGNIEIPKDYRQELAETIINDQKNSLDNWIDYLTSDDAKYPDWLKYYAFRSILKMGRYDKEKKKFTERYGGTVSPFPELNRETLAIVLGDIEKHESQDKNLEFIQRFDIENMSKEQYVQFLQQKNFAKLYVLAIEEFKPIQEELLKITAGGWIKYPRGSDPEPLVRSIANYGTGWCLRGRAIAERYLVRDKNDLYVYYSFDKEGKPTVPRVVMVVNPNNHITEIRGIAKEENLDPHIGKVVEEKLSEPEFKTEGLAYKKKSADMKLLTSIENKVKKGQELNKDNLVFLYEIDVPIEGFGYQKDPRIAELRSQRNPEEDMLIIFECGKDQIARNLSKIKEGTKAYVGSLAPDIFDKIKKYAIQHVYISFPEDKKRKETIKIGGKDAETLIKEMYKNNINISDYALDILRSPAFTVLEKAEDVVLFHLKVRDLGIPKQYPTTEDIWGNPEKGTTGRIQELGLELCPAEVAPNYRLQYQNQPVGGYVYIGMKPIIDRDGYSRVFGLVRDEDGPGLSGPWTKPTYKWNPDDELVFLLRKLGT